MKCKTIRELILTGYFDGELSLSMRKKVEAHLASCGQCRQFAAAVEEQAVRPLKGIREEMPPEFVWYRIKDKVLSSRRAEAGPFPAVRIGVLFRLPKPVYAIAVAVIVTSALFWHRFDSNRARQQEMIEYFAALVYETDISAIDNGTNTDTLIEEYFL